MENKKTFKVSTKNPEETKKWGTALGKNLRKGHVVLLLGNLGAGKTTFVKGVAKALGAEDEALSPTFIIAQTISGKIPLHHLDFYRVGPKEILEMGIEDYFTGAGEIGGGALLIEWADRFREIWPKERLEIYFSVKPGKDKREIVFKAFGKKYLSLLSGFSQ